MHRLIVALSLVVGTALASCMSAPVSDSGGSSATSPFHAFEEIRFPSLDTRGPNGAGLPITGYLFRPATDAPRPAVVLLHGCGGVVNSRGVVNVREAGYANQLVQDGYVVLIVDSFTPRGVRNMCAPSNFQRQVYQARPKDAYGALLLLQGKPFVRPDRIGVIGWSEGGGAVLMSIRTDASLGRPAVLPHGDFRTAIAFYPGSCGERRLGTDWNTRIPLLVLLGEKDVWSPLEPCQTLLNNAEGRGSPITLHIYAGAYHDFDYPGVMLHAEPQYRTSSGVVPIVAMDPAARDDTLARVQAFLGQSLLD